MATTQKKVVKTPANPSKPREQKLNKVVNGPVKKKEKGAMSKFSEAFFGEDIGNAKDYVLFDVIIPAVKDGLIDAVTSGLNMLLNGNRGTGNNRRPSRYSGNGMGYTNYNKVYTINQNPQAIRNSNSRYGSRGLKEDIILGMREEAEDVLESLKCAIDEYSVVSVADLYDLLGETSEYTDQKYGWTDLSSARIKRVPEGFLIQLPRCIIID